jgi:hypothetical protein
MKKWLESNIMSTLSLAGIVGAAVYFGAVEGRWFSSPEKKYKTEEMIEDLDPVKLYGEYIIDSIEEVNTQQYRREQKIVDSLFDIKLHRMDSLLRLNIYITNKGVKKSDTLNQNIEHAIEHVH